MELSAAQVAAFQALEQKLWIAETRGDRAWMDTVLSPTFTEHGRSGNTYGRDEVLESDTPDHIPVELPLSDFTARLIDSVSVLVTYLCKERVDDSTRASLWCHDGTRWRLEFHQGTPARRQQQRSLTMTASEIRAGEFATTMRGYNRAAVDQFLQDVANSIDAGNSPEPIDVARTRFELALRGYDPVEVDEFMARIKEGLG